MSLRLGAKDLLEIRLIKRMTDTNGRLMYLSEEQVKGFLEVIPKRHPSHFFLFYTLWKTGLRITEALYLKIRDIDLLNSRLRITFFRGEVKVHRWIGIDSELGNVLQAHINLIGPDSFLFPFTRQISAQMCIRYALRSGIGGWVRCHTFRHSFAINYLVLTSDIWKLQDILGHRDLRVAKEYVKMIAKISGGETDEKS